MSNTQILFAAFTIFIHSVSVLPIYAESNEIPSRGPISFSTYDINSNGVISEDEFNIIRGQRMASKAAEGRQMQGMAGTPSFADFDTNSDGKLSMKELSIGQEQQMNKRRRIRQGQGNRSGNKMGKGNTMPSLSDFDLNGDGKVFKQEFYEARNKRIGERAKQGYQMRNLGKAPSFEDIDTNGNGQLSEQEFKAHQALHNRQQMK